MAEQYPEHFVRRLEILWGDGFMSPGGAGEVHEALLGIDIRGKRILDFGCGIGGPSFVLAASGAAEVIGIDIEPQLVARATVSAGRLGLGNVSFQCVEPGPLGFADQSFDMVFSKEALLHIPDKEAIFRDFARLLRRGGMFAGSDWLASENCRDVPEWLAYRSLARYSINPVTAAQCLAAMEKAGFVQVSSRDRNAWYADVAQRDLARIAGDLRASLIAAAGPDIYEDWLTMRRAQTAAVVAGAHRPTHLRGVKP